MKEVKRMTPETKGTLIKIGGALGLMVGTVALVYFFAPELRETFFQHGMLVAMAAIGVTALIVISLKAITYRNGNNRKNPTR